MKIFGLEIRRIKSLSAVDTRGGGGWFSIVREAWGGAFQSVVSVDAPRQILAFSGVFACITVIASDIGKLRVKLVEEDSNGATSEVKGNSSPFANLLKKPNRWQNRIKFVEQWIISKLLYGNTYVLKQRDQRGMVSAMYILDAQRVTPLIAEDGGVYYQLSPDHLAQLPATVTVPASEIIHDRMCCLWHPLVGVSPIYACGISATMGGRIQANSTKFFDNMSRPSGVLTAPGTISTDTANRLKDEWERNFSGNNIGRLAVLGDGLKYEGMVIPAQQAQLLEQLRWTVEDVARCYHVPLYKIGAETGAQAGTRLSIESLNQAYYTDCLQSLIENFELCLDEGLAVPTGKYVELDLKGLLRMDTAARYAANKEGVSGGWLSPNEARASENLKPIRGGETPYLQQQNYSLAALAKRDAGTDPFSTGGTGRNAPALPAATIAAADQQFIDMMDEIVRGLDVAAEDLGLNAEV